MLRFRNAAVLLYGAGCCFHSHKVRISLRSAISLTRKREYHCAVRRPKEEPEEKTFEQAYAQRGCCLFVKIRDPVATADMRRHSDTLRAANAATKEEVNGGENTRTSFLRSEGVVVPVRSTKFCISPPSVLPPATRRRDGHRGKALFRLRQASRLFRQRLLTAGCFLR